jgi:adenylyl-sulfate kinase
VSDIPEPDRNVLVTQVGLFLSPPAAAALDREAAGYPELALSATDLSRVELRMSLAPDEPGAIDLPAPKEPLTPGQPVALRDAEGVLLAVVTVESVADGRVTGRLRAVRLPAHPDARGLRHTPASLQEELQRRGWQRPAAVLTGRPLYRADLDRLSSRLEGPDPADGVVVAVLAGGLEATDPVHHARLAAVRAGLAALPADRVLLAVIPLSPAASGEQRRRVAAAYGLPDADVEPAPGAPDDRLVTAVLEAEDAVDPSGAVGPHEVVTALRRIHRPRSRQGFTVFFTGLSGSGKSTVAGLLAVRLLELTDRRVLLLDGDRVRRNLTAGLGFSRADRDTNVRRIGWVAAQVTAAGGVAVCAPIAPYADTRREVRAMVENGAPVGGFVLVHIATPLEECERRDRKGLYAKARAGQLPEFTGISDPYDVPTDAEVVADTTGRDPADVVEQVVAHLVTAGYLVRPAITST